MESNQIFDPIFEISIKNNEVLEKKFSSPSGKNMGLFDANLPIFALNLKQLIAPDLENNFSF
jgi:hypothetical protein